MFTISLKIATRTGGNDLFDDISTVCVYLNYLSCAYLIQDRVLGIINLIMDELLGDDRACRAFRAKFPEEVLQESLAGQLWFGAECLSAGSAILNREAESAEMRPLAKAVRIVCMSESEGQREF